MAAEFGKAIFTLSADDSQLDAKLRSAEGKVEQASTRISTKMVAMSAAIGAALGSVLGGYVSKLVAELDKIPSFFTNAYKVTAQYGEEMETLGARMGMTAQQASTLTGMMERQGIGAGVAIRSMQMLSMEMRQTVLSADPLNTRLGRLLGTLRDSNGAILSTSQVLDLARQKISSAGGATEQLLVAQEMFGTRVGGQLLPMLRSSNEEWDKQKKSVENALGPVEDASAAALKYREAVADLDQKLKGLQITIGTAVLPSIISFTKFLGDLTQASSDAGGRLFGDQGIFRTTTWVAYAEMIGLISEKTRDSAQSWLTFTDSAGKAAKVLNEIKTFSLAGMYEEDFQKLAVAQSRMTQDAEKAQRLGIITSQERKQAIQDEKIVLDEQIRRQEELLSGKKGGIDPNNPTARIEAERKILEYRTKIMQLSARDTGEDFRQQELQAKALGLINSTTEIQFLQLRLQDANMEREERLKVEGELFQKRKQYAEQAVNLARQLGFIQIQEELKFRSEKTKDMLSKGDVLGAAGEMKKIQDLTIKEADESVAFIKKIHIISIQSEINYQKQKLEAVKGNAQEERNVLMSIADLDKQLYDRRLEYAINYTKSLKGAGKAVLEASAAGESMTPEQAKIDAERQNTEAGREARSVAEHGGTDEQREAAIAWAQTMKKQVEETAALGEKLSSRMEESWDTAKAVFTAFGVKNVADPTGPSASVGSALSQTEGLATANLARGSQIPNLDTSYTDLAIRVRDVFLGTIPNITSFSDAIKQATAKITGTFGNPINTPPGGGSGPGGIQFGPGSSQEALSSGPSSTAQPPSAGFGTLTRSFGPSSAFGSSTETVGGSSLVALPELQALTKTLQDHVTTQKEISQKLQNATDALNKAADFTKRVQVDVGVDPNSQEGFKAVSREATAESIRQ